MELALEQGGGDLIVHAEPPRPSEMAGPSGPSNAPDPFGTDILFSSRWACQSCGASYEELTPQSFSFNSPLGWCPGCEGLGLKEGIDPALVAPDRSKTLRQGALAVWGSIARQRPLLSLLDALGERFGFNVDTPLQELTPEQWQVLLHGCDEAIPFPPGARPDSGPPPTFRYRGLLPTLTALLEDESCQREIAPLMRELPCPACGGSRLRPEARAVRWHGKTLPEITEMSLGEAWEWFQSLSLTEREKAIGGEVLREVRARLRFLNDMGLDYLTLSRPAPTLSGGEAQRIRLASQIGSGLTGVLYILDEPSIGLHARDNERLLKALRNLRDLGNTVLVVEHDPAAIQAADFVLDFGPGAGRHGGTIVAQGTPDEIAQSESSLTGAYLSRRRQIPLPRRRRRGNGQTLTIRGARHHNLKNLEVHFPLGTLICVTGVSGSGKSSLVHDILYRALAHELHHAHTSPGEHDRIEGIEFLDKVIHIDQTPIGFTPRSDPATYIGAFEAIRMLYAQLPEAKARGYTPARFSFNRPGGRCEACWGYGYKKIEMHFLADVWVKCDVCNGARYNWETLQIKYRDKSIAEVLEMTAAEAREHFANVPHLCRMLQTLIDVGLDYIQLGQSATTLSAGEAQRVKLARELSRPSTGQTLYLLDEPTTGLHFADIEKLLEVLNRLVDEGNTVVVVEHNMEVIKTADFIIDLGPEAGEAGGTLVAQGTPEQVAQVEASHTGRILRRYLDLERRTETGTEPPVVAESHGGYAANRRPPAFIADPDERWHKLHGAFSQERDALWTGEDLQAFIDLALSTGRVEAPDWSNPEFVTLHVRGVKRWWCRLKTGQPDYFRVLLRLPRRQFTERELQGRLGLKPWLEQDPPVECRTPRLALKSRKEEDELWLDLASRKEFETEALRELLQQAAENFQ